MEREPKGPGISKACRACKGELISSGTFFGIGWFWMFCRHCAEENKVTIGVKYLITVSVVAFVFIAHSFFVHVSAAKKITCDSFSTHTQAQAIFDTGYVYGAPNKYQQLDKNFNNIACQDLP